MQKLSLYMTDMLDLYQFSVSLLFWFVKFLILYG